MIKKTLLFFIFFIFSASAVKVYALPNSVEQCFIRLKNQSYRSAEVWGVKAVKNHPRSFYAHMCLAAAYHRLGDLLPAIKVLKQSIPLAGNKGELETLYEGIGSSYGDVSDYKNALLYDFKALNLAKELKERRPESIQLNNISNIYADQGDFTKALYYAKKSLALIRTKKGMILLYSNIGAYYSEMGNYTKAIKYEKKALILDKNIGDYYATAVIFLNLGDSYIYAGNYLRAKNYINKGLKMEKKIGDKDWIAAGYRYFGSLYRHENNGKKALSYYTKAFAIYNSIGDSKGAKVCLYRINKIKNQQ
ncbi:MAG: tetratricopeptide repeat protein [bacterium]